MIKLIDSNNDYNEQSSYDKKNNGEMLKRNSSSVSIALLLSKNGVFENESSQRVTSEPVKRKTYNQHKYLRNQRSSRQKVKQRACSLDREAIDRFKYFKSLCAIRPSNMNLLNATLKDEKTIADTKSTSENLRKYFEDLSNHKKNENNLIEESVIYRKPCVNRTSQFSVDYKNKSDENKLRQSKCCELRSCGSIGNSSTENSISDESSASSTISTDSQLNLLKLVQNRIRNIEVPFDKLPEIVDKKENNLQNIQNVQRGNGLEKMKSEKFKFPKLVLQKQEEINQKILNQFSSYKNDEQLNSSDENDEDKNLDDFLFFGKNESKNNCQYQSLTRQNRMIFYDVSHEKPRIKIKPINQNDNDAKSINYIANLPSLPKENRTQVKQKSMTVDDVFSQLENNHKSSNRIAGNGRHSKLETLSVITEEECDSYFSLISPVHFTSNSSTNMSSSSQLFNHHDLFIVETPPQSNCSNIFKTQNVSQMENKPTIQSISKNVSAFIKSKMSIFEVEKINNNNNKPNNNNNNNIRGKMNINENFNSKVNFNNSSKYRLKNLNEEKVKNM